MSFRPLHDRVVVERVDSDERSAGGIIKCLFTGRYAELEHFVDAFCEGYHNGRAAHFLLEVRWEQLWSEPLDSLRQRFGIVTAKPRTPR